MSNKNGFVNSIMSVFRRKKDTVLKNDDSGNVCPQTKEIVDVIVPKWEIIDNEPPKLEDKFNTFSMILEHKYRLTSEHSKEVFRIFGTGHTYTLGKTSNITNNKTFTYNWGSYVKSDSLYHFIVRVFKTSNNRYFMQCVRGDGSVFYQRIELPLIRQMVESWEYGNRAYPNNTRFLENVPKPNTYKVIGNHIDNRDDSNISLYNYAEEINSLEVIDRESYDGIFENL